MQKKDNKQADVVYLVVFVITLLILAFAIRMLPADKSIQENTELEQEDDIAYLELHFGNGEIYRQEIVSLCLAEYYDGRHGRNYATYGDDYSFIGLSEMSYDNVFRLQNGFAKLPEGHIYSFSEAYKIIYDEETVTISLFLWRDEPYQLEKEVFEKIEKVIE